MIVFSLNLVVTAFKYRFEVWTDKIRMVGSWGTKELTLSEIAGYKATRGKNGRAVFFISNRRRRKFRVFSMFGDDSGFDQWVESSFRLLNDDQIENEWSEIKHKEDLEKLEKLREFKSPIWWLIFLSWLVSFWGFLSPTHQKFYFWFAVLMPLLGIFLRFIFPSVFRFNAGNKGPFVPVELFLIPGPTYLAIHAFLDWDIADWSYFWEPFLLFSIFLFSLGWRISPELRQEKFRAAMFMVFCLIYVYGCHLEFNGIYTSKLSAVIPCRVIEKRMEQGIFPGYYMTLGLDPKFNGWGPREFKISPNFFQAKEIGSPVEVAVRPGAFRVSFYLVNER